MPQRILTSRLETEFSSVLQQLLIHFPAEQQLFPFRKFFNLQQRWRREIKTQLVNSLTPGWGRRSQRNGERQLSEFLKEATNPDGAPSGVAPVEILPRWLKRAGRGKGEGRDSIKLSYRQVDIPAQAVTGHLGTTPGQRWKDISWFRNCSFWYLNNLEYDIAPSLN